MPAIIEGPPGPDAPPRPLWKRLAWFAGFRGLWAIYIHANVRMPIGPLRLLIPAPGAITV